MTQEEKWDLHYKEVADYIRTYQRCPSKHRVEDHLMLNWIKYNRKLIAKGMLDPMRLRRFSQLEAQLLRYRHVNQYA